MPKSYTFRTFLAPPQQFIYFILVEWEYCVLQLNVWSSKNVGYTQYNAKNKNMYGKLQVFNPN